MKAEKAQSDDIEDVHNDICQFEIIDRQ